MTDRYFVPEKTEVLHDKENTISFKTKFFSNSKIKIDIFVDRTSPLTIINNQTCTKDFIDAYKRGVKIRFITEITKENIGCCKQVKKFVDEFRHLEGLQGAICVNEFRVFRYYRLFCGKSGEHYNT
jgi:two-component system, OmpR family, sensor histidine kinase VicK